MLANVKYELLVTISTHVQTFEFSLLNQVSQATLTQYLYSVLQNEVCDIATTEHRYS